MDTKAVVIGGSSGIGRSLARALAAKGYQVTVLDIREPESLPEGARWRRFDLCDREDGVLEELAGDPGVRLVAITAGIGRVAGIESLREAEIDRVFQVDAVSTIQALRRMYPRLRGKEPFYCGVIGSIAGLVSSPLFSVYGAAKAALARFVESVNIELEMAGTENRILNVCPGKIEGTRFYGGEDRPEMTAPLAEEILARLLRRETLYIPDEETYGEVLRRYGEDPHGFGVDSYRYKERSGRAGRGRGAIVGYTSGTFDVFHIGHLNLLRRARENCDYLIVGVHDSGKWKGKETLIPFEERKAIVGACRFVDRVVDACVEDSDAWDRWRFDRLFVGSDYKGSERFARYEEFFRARGVEITYFPYTQATSSTQIRDLINSRVQGLK